MTHELLGAVHVEDHAGVGLTRRHQRHTRRDVRLDETGHHIDRRALRRDHQVDADGPRHLRDTADGGVPAGSEGLLFLPYLSGERSPHPDPLARGAFVGLTVGHERRHLTRAVLEGVAFGLRDGLDLMVAAGMPAPATIRASGGGTASPVWRQILADVLEAEIATVATTEGAAYGAGVLAAVGGAGWFGTVPEATDAWVHATVMATPGPGRSAYREAHARYRGLYPALAPTFHRTP